MKDLYKSTFSKLHASPQTVREIVQMEEKKTQRRLRPVWMTALCACVLAAGALTANAATGGELFRRVLSLTAPAGEDAHYKEVIGEEGEAAPESPEIVRPENALEMAVLGNAGSEQQAMVYTTAEGAVWLSVPGEDDRDITDQTAESGGYAFDFTQDGRTVKGLVEKSGSGLRCYSEEEDGTVTEVVLGSQEDLAAFDRAMGK